jgi:hypothetical protein
VRHRAYAGDDLPRRGGDGAITPCLTLGRRKCQHQPDPGHPREANHISASAVLQPEPHVHLAVHRRGGGEVLLSLLPLAQPPVELAEAEVAMGDQRAHFHFRPAQEVMVVAVRLLDGHVCAGSSRACPEAMMSVIVECGPPRLSVLSMPWIA